MNLATRFTQWLQRTTTGMVTTRHHLRGIAVTVANTRPDIDTAEVVARLDAALALIERHTPHYYRHLRRDFSGIVVQRYACRGAYFPATGQCMVELTFTVNPAMSLAEVAATILHEAMHARLHRLRFPLEMDDRARQERFCRRAEIEFGALVPDGRPVIARALGALHGSDADVAPLVDDAVAARRIAEADAAALTRRRTAPKD